MHTRPLPQNEETLPVYLLDTLPPEIICLILAGLLLTDMLAITNTCKYYHQHGFFKSEIHSRQLLSYVMQANEKAAEEHIIELTEQAPTLWSIIFNVTPGKEACGRVWQAVSPLQFAAWIGNYEMVTMLLRYVPEEGKQQAVAQLNHVKKNGLEHGKRMAPFYHLIDAYTQIATTYQSYAEWKDLIQHCIINIGSLQYQLSHFGLQLLLSNDEQWMPFHAINLGTECFITRYNSSQPIKIVSQNSNPFGDRCFGDALTYEAGILSTICKKHKERIDQEIKLIKLSLQAINSAKRM